MNTLKKVALGLLGIILPLCASSVSKNVFADDNGSTLTVSPMTQKIILVPGERYEGAIKVSNPNLAKSDMAFSLSTSPFSTVGENYDVDLGTESTYTQMKDWISFSETQASVSPNETKIIPFYINVPADAPAGGQYATILVTNDTDFSKDYGENGNVSISSVMQISSIIYATIMGETKETGEIINNKLPSIVFTTPLTGSFTTKNTGNVHMDSKATLQVFPLFSNEEIYTNEEEPQKNLAMPETTKFNTISWDNAPAFGIFHVIQKVEFAGKISTIDKYVLICPIWLLFIIIFAIIIIIFYFVAKSKSRKKK